jgi:hypothetical protein
MLENSVDYATIPHFTPGRCHTRKQPSDLGVCKKAEDNFPKARLGMESPGGGLACLLTRVGPLLPMISAGHLAQDAAASAGPGHTHQGFEVLTVVAGVGGREGPQHRVALVALQR